jgi:hypothetical protein
MAGIRQRLVTLLALIGLLVAVQPASARAGACPLDSAATAAMPMMHHHSGSPSPMNRDVQNCPACLCVLPSLPVIERHVLPPVALVAGQALELSGIDPALDPPPPRGA